MKMMPLSRTQGARRRIALAVHEICAQFSEATARERWICMVNVSPRMSACGSSQRRCVGCLPLTTGVLSASALAVQEAGLHQNSSIFQKSDRIKQRGDREIKICSLNYI